MVNPGDIPGVSALAARDPDALVYYNTCSPDVPVTLSLLTPDWLQHTLRTYNPQNFPLDVGFYMTRTESLQ